MLTLNYAFHCSYLDPIREELLASLADIHPQQARIRFISTVTGRELVGTECDATYWWENIRLPVQFAEGVNQLLSGENPLFLEIGPHPVLAHYLAECMEFSERVAPYSLRCVVKKTITLPCSVRWQRFIHAAARFAGTRSSQVDTMSPFRSIPGSANATGMLPKHRASSREALSAISCLVRG